MKEQLTQETLKELLDYDPETGHFFWKVNRGQRIKAGDRAGCLNPTDGYIRIKVNYKLYLAHRLAVLYMTGQWPEEQVDHENHIRSDNRWFKLRGVTSQENNRNASMKRNNTSGFAGVSYHKGTDKWRATIMIDGRNKHLGLFTDPSEAHQAYQAKALELGYHKNHGRAA